MIAAMRALDNRMNQSAVEKQSLKSGKAAPRADGAPAVRFLLPPTVPEHEPLATLQHQQPRLNAGTELASSGDEAMAAAAYQQRAALVHGVGRLEPSRLGKGDAVASTWMTRAVARRF